MKVDLVDYEPINAALKDEIMREAEYCTSKVKLTLNSAFIHKYFSLSYLLGYAVAPRIERRAIQALDTCI